MQEGQKPAVPQSLAITLLEMWNIGSSQEESAMTTGILSGPIQLSTDIKQVIALSKYSNLITTQNSRLGN